MGDTSQRRVAWGKERGQEDFVAKKTQSSRFKKHGIKSYILTDLMSRASTIDGFPLD